MVFVRSAEWYNATLRTPRRGRCPHRPGGTLVRTPEASGEFVPGTRADVGIGPYGGYVHLGTQ